MSNQLPTDYQAFIHKSRYAKYFDGKGRESWGETVGRYMDNVVRRVTGDNSYIDDITFNRNCKKQSSRNLNI